MVGVRALAGRDDEPLEGRGRLGLALPELARGGARGRGVENTLVGAAVKGLEDTGRDGLGLVHDDHERAGAAVLGDRVAAVPAFGALGLVGREANPAGAVGGRDLQGGLVEVPALELVGVPAQVGEELRADLAVDAGRADDRGVREGGQVPEDKPGDDRGGLARAIGGPEGHAGAGILHGVEHVALPGGVLVDGVEHLAVAAHFPAGLGGVLAAAVVDRDAEQVLGEPVGRRDELALLGGQGGAHAGTASWDSRTPSRRAWVMASRSAGSMTRPPVTMVV